MFVESSEEMAKVSVIIPVYNVEQYLRECLDSVVNQTLKDIEIICVDDCSKDSSKAIIEEYCVKDSRVKGIYLETTSSALVARKKGVECACGDYVLFLDADDYIEVETCFDLYKKITETGVEILQFNSIIENCANIPESRIKFNKKLLKPYLGKLEEKEVFSGCFFEKRYGITLWNKLFSTKLLKKSFLFIEDEYLPKAQDLYTFFVISYFAKSYLGWDSKCYYHYCFGRGVTGNNLITIDVFNRYCKQSRVVDALVRFSKKLGIYDSVVGVIKKYEQQWMNECVQLWFDKVNENDREKVNVILLENWGDSDLVSVLANKFWFEKDVVAQKMASIKGTKINKKITKIGIYYYHFTMGGVQRVVLELLKLYKNMGYEVVLITDKKGVGSEFVLDDEIEWVTVQDYQGTNRENYNNRRIDWTNIIKKYGLDIILYHGWTSNLLLWDLLTFRINKTPVIVQTHSVFSYSLISYNLDFSILPYVMRMASGVVTLSKVDKLFWSFFNDNVYFIPNPIDQKLLESNRTKAEGNLILWVGRFSKEKQPLETLKILKEVIKVMPDATLWIIGGSNNEKVVNDFEKQVMKYGLEKNVKLLGFQKNVYQYFEKASLNLLTSMYEGFPMVILEAKAHGVPTVMYNMPYLENISIENGVKVCDEPNQVAIEIINLLKDKQSWKQLSTNAINNFNELAMFDYHGAWENVFSGNNLEKDFDEKVLPVLMDTIIRHYKTGWKMNNKVIMGIKGLGTDTVFASVGRIIMLVINCYKENGFLYTLKKCKEKLMN